MEPKSQIKSGVVFSYALLFFSVFYGLFITPFLLKYIGESDYGVFKTISSLSSSLAIMDLGLGTTMTRYMAQFHAEDDIKKANNFSAMIFTQLLVLISILFIIGLGLYFSIDSVYSKTFSNRQLTLSKVLLIFLILNMALRLFENLLVGIANGFEHFTVAHGLKFFSMVIKMLVLLVILPIIKNVILVVVIETVILVASIAFLLFYIVKKVGIVPKITKWDWSVFKESFVYTLLMFIQSVTVQFNGNIDNVIIGAKISAASVTVYSMALLIFGMYENLSGSIANVMLPNMAKRVKNGESAEQLQRAVEKAGKYQFLLLAAALGGFTVLGRDFYSLWLGEGYSDCYWLTLMLIIPITFPMIQNVCLSILRAQNKMVYRTVTLAVSCVINVVITVIGINLFGYWGAALGTAAATVSNLIMMNIYYHKNLKFNIVKMFARIIGKTLPTAVAATLITWVIHKFFHGTWLSFAVNAVIFVLVYGLILLLWGLNKEEKTVIFGRFIKGDKA